MPRILALWRPGADLTLPPARVFQELEYGEDVAGLIDLPIQEMIRELRSVFPELAERAGIVEGPSALGALNVTWSWQWMRIEYMDVTSEELTSIQRLAKQFECGVYDSDSGAWTEVFA